MGRRAALVACLVFRRLLDEAGLGTAEINLLAMDPTLRIHYLQPNHRNHNIFVRLVAVAEYPAARAIALDENTLTQGVLRSKQGHSANASIYRHESTLSTGGAVALVSGSQ